MEFAIKIFIAFANKLLENFYGSFHANILIFNQVAVFPGRTA